MQISVLNTEKEVLEESAAAAIAKVQETRQAMAAQAKQLGQLQYLPPRLQDMQEQVRGQQLYKELLHTTIHVYYTHVQWIDKRDNNCAPHIQLDPLWQCSLLQYVGTDTNCQCTSEQWLACDILSIQAGIAQHYRRGHQE